MHENNKFLAEVCKNGFILRRAAMRSLRAYRFLCAVYVPNAEI